MFLMVDSVAAMWKTVSAHSRLNLSRTFFRQRKGKSVTSSSPFLRERRKEIATETVYSS